MAEYAEINRFGVHGSDGAIGTYDQIHQPAPVTAVLRRIRRRGRSTSIASSVV